MKPCTYTVLRDTREKEGQGWGFAPSKYCAGTIDATLPTGDYTILGSEATFVIERKGSIGEFAGNLYQARFVRELERLRSFTHAYIILEFTLDDILNFPASSSIPRSRWKYLKVTPAAFLKRVANYELDYPNIRFISAGASGRAYASSLFKRIAERDGVKDGKPPPPP